MSDEQPLVVTEGLTKHFPLRGGHAVHALDGVSLTIHEKEIVGLVGESGSGKSTYGKTVIGLHDKTAGTVTYRGEQLPQRYQPKDEIAEWEKKDPIARYEATLLEHGWATREELDAIAQAVLDELDGAIAECEDEPFPEAETALTDIYVDPPAAPALWYRRV